MINNLYKNKLSQFFKNKNNIFFFYNTKLTVLLDVVSPLSQSKINFTICQNNNEFIKLDKKIKINYGVKIELIFLIN